MEIKLVTRFMVRLLKIYKNKEEKEKENAWLPIQD